MSRQLRITHALTVSAMVITFGLSAQAGATRTFVATTGNDSNAASNCGATNPCRTFTAALSVTNSGGEIVVLNSGGYGPATISQAVIITAIGVDASISVTTPGGTGLTINALGSVTLVGLNLHGEITGNNGVDVMQVGSLRLYNMLIENFVSNGVNMPVAGTLSIYDSTFNDDFIGVSISNAASSLYVQGSSFDDTLNGVAVANGHGTVTYSSVQHSVNAYRVDGAGATLALFNDGAIANTTALFADTGGALYFANCVIANNTTAYNVASGSTIAGTIPGTNFIVPGQATSGTLGTPVALQ